MTEIAGQQIARNPLCAPVRWRQLTHGLETAAVAQSSSRATDGAARESHYGENVLITRKGAVRAREGDMGIIPGSMGARSYIVRGKGNPASYCSCSHGAGRKMSRGAAKRAFSFPPVLIDLKPSGC